MATSRDVRDQNQGSGTANGTGNLLCIILSVNICFLRFVASCDCATFATCYGPDCTCYLVIPLRMAFHVFPCVKICRGRSQNTGAIFLWRAKCAIACKKSHQLLANTAIITTSCTTSSSSFFLYEIWNFLKNKDILEIILCKKLYIHLQ